MRALRARRPGGRDARSGAAYASCNAFKLPRGRRGATPMLPGPALRAATLALVLAAPAALVAVPEAESLPVDAGVGPEVYHVWPYLTADLAALAATHPTLARLSSMGKSVQGFDLWVLEIANFLEPLGDKPKVYFDGGHHGNEQLGLEATYAVAVKLLNDYFTNSTVKRIVDSSHIVLVPSVNPDGTIANTRKNAHGVDLNRNYPFHWGEPGCSHNPGSATYCGPAAMSEPEAKANVAFVEALRPDVYVTMHTGVTMLLHPWGWTRAASPDAALYDAVGRELRNLTGIPSGPASTMLYIASGTSMDWAYGTTGAPSWTFEVNGEQGEQLSRADIERRLAKPLLGLWWFLAHAGEVGADVAIGEARAEPLADGAFEVRVALANAGLGDARVEATLAAGAPLALEGPASVAVEVPAKGAAEAVFRVRAAGDGEAPLTLSLGYTRTRHLGEAVTAEGPFVAAVTEGGTLLRLAPA